MFRPRWLVVHLIKRPAPLVSGLALGQEQAFQLDGVLDQVGWPRHQVKSLLTWFDNILTTILLPPGTFNTEFSTVIAIAQAPY